MFKRTFVSGLIAATVAAGTLAGTIQPSAAHDHRNEEIGIGIAAGVGGFLLGSALAPQPRTVYVEEEGGSWHVRRCMARYPSYDPDSNTYIGYDGYEHYCRL